MIAIIQMIISLTLTLLYAIFQVDYSVLMSILSIIGVFLLINIAFILLVVLMFIILTYLTAGVKPNTVWKHNLLMRFSNYLFVSLMRVKPIPKGLENIPDHNRFVMYANHIEYNDPFYIKMFYKNSTLAYVSKEPLFKIPFLKTLLKSIGCLPIGKMADRKSLATILEAIKQVKSGQPMGVFPEGKRSYSNDPIPFKPGAFKVAQKAKADISLVAIYDFHKMNINRFRIKKVRVYLHFLPIIKYEDYKDLDTVAISELAYSKIKDALDDYKKQLDK